MSSSLSPPQNIYAVGRNYHAHAAELGNPIPREPVIFQKAKSTLTDGGNLCFPNALSPIHFELELVIRVGQRVTRGSGVGVGCISHITLGIDFTARTLQTKLKQAGLPWFSAKNFQNACFLDRQGLVSLPQTPIGFQLYQNGRMRQSGDSAHMIFNFSEIVNWINLGLDLHEGDLIYTGTPQGVGPVENGDRLRLVSEALEIDREIQITYES